RLILNLNDLATYTTRIDGNSFVVEVGAVKGGEKARASRPAVEVARAASTNDRDTFGNQTRITNIDFRRGTSGEGRVIVTLSNPKVSADMVGTGAGVRLSFKNAWLPPELRRRLDVVDFATPVSLVAAGQEG